MPNGPRPFTQKTPNPGMTNSGTSVTCRIHLGSVPVWVMDRFKEGIDQYVCGQWLSSIALAGIIAEFLSFHLMEEYVKSNGILRPI